MCHGRTSKSFHRPLACNLFTLARTLLALRRPCNCEWAIRRRTSFKLGQLPFTKKSRNSCNGRKEPLDYDCYSFRFSRESKTWKEILRFMIVTVTTTTKSINYISPQINIDDIVSEVLDWIFCRLYENVHRKHLLNLNDHGCKRLKIGVKWLAPRVNRFVNKLWSLDP